MQISQRFLVSKLAKVIKVPAVSVWRKFDRVTKLAIAHTILTGNYKLLSKKLDPIQYVCNLFGGMDPL